MNPRETRGAEPHPRAEAPTSEPAVTGALEVTDRRQFLLRLARTSAFVAPALYSVSIGALPAAAVSSPRYRVCDWNSNPEKCEKVQSAPVGPEPDRHPGGSPPVWERNAAPSRPGPQTQPAPHRIDRPL